MLRVVLFLCAGAAVVLAARGDSTPVNSCTHRPGPLPTRGYVQGCDTLPCVVTQDDEINIFIDFTAPRDIPTMRTRVTAFITLDIGGIMWLPVPYLLENPFTCDRLNSTCPVAKDTPLQHKLRIPIQRSLPLDVQSELEFSIVDQNSNPVVCMRVAITVVAPAQVSP